MKYEIIETKKEFQPIEIKITIENMGDLKEFINVLGETGAWSDHLYDSLVDIRDDWR